MKKIIVMLLAMVVALSLTACGGEKIEITTDNWQDYLEVKEAFIVDEHVDAFGDVTERFIFKATMLCLNDQYTGKTIEDDTNVAVKYSGNITVYNCVLKDDGTVTVGEKSYSESPFEETVSRGMYTFVSEGAKETLAENDCVILLRSTGDREAFGVIENLEISRIEGTLVLE